MFEHFEKYNRTFLSKEGLTGRLKEKIDSVDLNRVLSAYELAENVHQFQRRNDQTPYFWHPTRVTKILIDELGISDPDLIIGALLHDTLEDSDILTPEVLQYNFGSYPSYIVQILTKEVGIKDGPLRDQIDQEYIDRINNSSEDCRIIKLADRLDNLRCLEFNLKRNPIKYVNETNKHYLPMAENSPNPHLHYLLTEIHKERNKFFG